VDATLLYRVSPEDKAEELMLAPVLVWVREVQKNGGYCGNQYQKGCGQMLLMVHGSHQLITCVGVKQQIDQRSRDN
jgi:hypothetical protein